MSKRRVRSRKKRSRPAVKYDVGDKYSTAPKIPAETLMRLTCLSMLDSVITDEASEQCKKLIDELKGLEGVHPGLILSAVQLMLFLDFVDVLPDGVAEIMPDMNVKAGVALLFEADAEIEIMRGKRPEIFLYKVLKRFELIDLNAVLELKAHLGRYSSASEMIADRAAIPAFSLRYRS